MTHARPHTRWNRSASCLHANDKQRVTRVEEKQILLEGGETIPYG